MIQILILAFGVVNLFLAVYSIFKIRQNKEKLSFIWWWGFISGTFVWEDMLVIGVLHFIFSLVSTILNNPIIWLICFLAFWVVRSAGEALYFMLQQFIQPKHHPHYITSHFTLLRKVFGNISDQKCFIILQVSMQSILVLSLLLLIYILRIF